MSSEQPTDGAGTAQTLDSHASAATGTIADTRTFPRAVLGTVVGAIVPGLGMILGRHRRTGAIILAGFVLLIAVAAIAVLVDKRGVLALALTPEVMRIVGIALIVAALGWIAVIVLTHVWLRPTNPTTAQRGAGAALVAVLAFLVSAPLAVGSVYAMTSAASLGSIFKTENESKSATRPSTRPSTHPSAKSDPWAGTTRVNLLLLGGDSDGGKRDGVRTDTVIVASIDTHTGDTTLISLPRNTARMPFPQNSPLYQHYPYGFTNGNGEDAEFMLNAMYGNIPAVLGPDILGPTDNVGADILKLSVGEAVGLHIDYYVLLDIQGFSKLINALGGITVNINERVAVGGSTDHNRPPERWLEPGPNQHLNGNDAMWFARGRYGAAGGDFDRMDRQRCVINAMIRQVNPANVLSRYEAIVREGGQLVLTDITQEELPAFVELSLRVKGGDVRSLVFKNDQDGFYSSNPDFALMRDRVSQAIAETTGEDEAGEAEESPSGEPGAEDEPASEDANDACAYHPQ